MAEYSDQMPPQLGQLQVQLPDPKLLHLHLSLIVVVVVYLRTPPPQHLWREGAVHGAQLNKSDQFAIHVRTVIRIPPQSTEMRGGPLQPQRIGFELLDKGDDEPLPVLAEYLHVHVAPFLAPDVLVTEPVDLLHRGRKSSEWSVLSEDVVEEGYHCYRCHVLRDIVLEKMLPQPDVGVDRVQYRNTRFLLRRHAGPDSSCSLHLLMVVCIFVDMYFFNPAFHAVRECDSVAQKNALARPYIHYCPSDMTR